MPVHVTLAELVERLCLIPADARSFTWNEEQAALHFGLDGATLRELVDLGLPSVRTDLGLGFAHVDLHYVGMRLGTAAAHLWAVRQWAESLERLTGRDRSHVTIAYIPQLVGGAGVEIGCVQLPSGEVRAAVLENGRCAAEERVALEAGWPELPPAARRIVDEVAPGLDFCLVPDGLRGDVASARRIGLLDCFTAACLLVEAWCAAGLDARLGSGMLVSVPYSTPHTWAEIRVGERWVPVDPLMISVMRDYGGLDAERWPLHRSLGPMVLRLGEDPSPLAWTDRGPVDVTLMTTAESR